jgi:hypothetical protein
MTAQTTEPVGANAPRKRKRLKKQISIVVRSPSRKPRESPSLTRKATAIDRMQKSYGNK